MKDVNQEDCHVCYKIICKQCKWEADARAVEKIQCGEITACPDCGWKPGQPVL
jgi:DNA-directed RNA polymerase subunit RPC12/RpoP